MSEIFTLKGNIKKVETIKSYGSDYLKTTEIFDKKNRKLKIQKVNREEKVVYEKTVNYDDVNNVIKSSSNRVSKNKNIRETFIQDLNNQFYYKQIKVFIHGELKEHRDIYNPPVFQKTIEVNEKETIELKFGLDGRLKSLVYLIYNSKKLLNETYFFSRKDNALVRPVPDQFTQIYPMIPKALNYFNFNISGELINNELNLYFFDSLISKKYKKGIICERREQKICFDDITEENFELFESTYEKFDEFGNIIESRYEGCGDGNVSLPWGASYENKYNDEGLLYEVYSKGNSRTIYTYDKAKKVKSKRTETFFYDAYGERVSDAVESIEDVEFDAFGNATKLIRRYFKPKTSEFEIGFKFYRLIEYWK
jgi:hypothetical protein